MEDIAETLKRIQITYYKESIIDEGTGKIEFNLKFKSEVAFELSGLKGFLFVFGNSRKATIVNVIIEMGYDSFKVKFYKGLKIRFSKELIRPVKKRFGKWKIDTGNKNSEILIDNTVVVDQDWNICFEGENKFSLGPVLVGETDIVIEGSVALDFSENNSIPESAEMGLDKSWRGVVFKTPKISFFSNNYTSDLSRETELPNLRIENRSVSYEFRGKSDFISLGQ